MEFSRNSFIDNTTITLLCNISAYNHHTYINPLLSFKHLYLTAYTYIQGTQLVPVPDSINGDPDLEMDGSSNSSNSVNGDQPLQSTTSWVNPQTYGPLFLPADLPLPQLRPALGVCVAQGVPRYIMPSVVLTLETPVGQWRNRGINSLPR